jgi:hypothetical protein
MDLIGQPIVGSGSDDGSDIRPFCAGVGWVSGEVGS